jgi:capsular exopolysaccharide synthesis family protein
MSQENLVEFEDYVAAIGRRKKLIVIVVTAFVIVGAAFSMLSTKEYTSESRVSVTAIFDPGEGATDPVNIDTEVGIAKSSAVATIAQGTLNTQASPSDLLDRVGVTPVGDSTILKISYTHPDPDAAYRGAAAFAEAYLEFRGQQADEATRQQRQLLESEKADVVTQQSQLESTLAGLEPGSPEYRDTASRLQALDGEVVRLDSQLEELRSSDVDPGTIIDAAEVPDSPSSPGLILNVAGGALIGLVLALTATFVLERKNLGTRREAEAAAAAVPEPTVPDPAPAAVAAPAPPALAPEPEPPAPAPSLASALPARSVPTVVPNPEPAPEPEIPDLLPPAPVRSRTRSRSLGALPPASEPTPVGAPADKDPAADRRQRRDASQALAGLQVELLGNVPRLSNDAGEPAFDAVALGGPSGEALRRLHATLWPRLEQNGAKVVFVTSAIERGVTVGLAGGLAATAALAGQDALLIAGDLHQPRLHDRLELGNDQGLAEVLSGTRPMTQVLQGWSGIENLCVVTAGRPGPDPSSLVASDRLEAQLDTVRTEFALIVIEGPPVGETPDALLMASVSDAVVLAVDPRHSAENELGGAVSRLRLAKAPLLGAVVVEARAPRAGPPPVAATPVPSRG